MDHPAASYGVSAALLTFPHHLNFKTYASGRLLAKTPAKNPHCITEENSDFGQYIGDDPVTVWRMGVLEAMLKQKGVVPATEGDGKFNSPDLGGLSSQVARDALEDAWRKNDPTEKHRAHLEEMFKSSPDSVPPGSNH